MGEGSVELDPTDARLIEAFSWLSESERVRIFGNRVMLMETLRAAEERAAEA